MPRFIATPSFPHILSVTQRTARGAAVLKQIASFHSCCVHQHTWRYTAYEDQNVFGGYAVVWGRWFLTCRRHYEPSKRR